MIADFLHAELMSLAVLASAGLCPAVPPPEMAVHIVRNPAQIRRDLSKTQLAEFRKDTDMPHQMLDLSHVETGGMVHSDIDFAYDIAFNEVPGNTAETVNDYCVRYGRIEITLQISPVIYIASDHAPGSCWDKEVREHEESHIDMDEVVVEKYAAQIEEGLKMAFSTPGDFIAGPVKAKGIDALKQSMGADVMAMVGAMTVNMAGERLEKQQGVDSLGGYAYMMERCYLPPE